MKKQLGAFLLLLALITAWVVSPVNADFRPRGGCRQGAGPPTGVVANPGACYQNTSGGASTTFYLKESGTDATGWVAYGPAANPATNFAGIAGGNNPNVLGITGSLGPVTAGTITSTAWARDPNDCVAGSYSIGDEIDGDATCTVLTPALPLAGGTMDPNAQIVVSNKGIEFTESDVYNPSCSAGQFTLWADTSENSIKICNGSQGIGVVSPWLTATTTISFPSINTGNCTDSTFALGGAGTTNPCVVGYTNAAAPAGSIYTCFVGAGPAVTIRHCCGGAGSCTPVASQLFRVGILKL